MQWEGILSWTITRRQVSGDLWLLRPSPVIAHCLMTKAFFRTGNEPSQQRGTKWSWNAPQSMVGFMTTRGPCQLQIGTYQEHCQWLNNKSICHLPLWRLKLMLLQLLTFNNPWGSSGWSEALCAPGNLPDRSLDSRMFLGIDFMIPILASPHI